ncbi:MAG: hypothetical protein PHX82_16795 [Paracoccaceae bacterium]|nr:hypothetical protein [Paracoccaceae bacterium]
MTVRFARTHGPYNPGDVAGFEAEVAQGLIEAGRAALWTGGGETMPAAPETVVPRIPVRFVRARGVYNPGEVAGFEPAQAAQLVAEGVAVPRAVAPVAPLVAPVPSAPDPEAPEASAEGIEDEAAPEAETAPEDPAPVAAPEVGTFVFDDAPATEPGDETEIGAPPVQGQI